MSDSLFVSRQSVRQYTAEPVEKEVVTALLQAAIQAPSAGNLQPWHFCVVTNQKLKEQIYQGAWRQRQIITAPVLIVVCAVPERAQSYGERGRNLYIYQDTAAAIENLLLAASQQQLGACWLGAFDEEAVRNALTLSTDYLPVALITLGYPKKIPKKPARLPLADVTSYFD
ncbi:nitroreductase family protein [Enterococcus nangangensis]|uniref:nitroreductase family protein n=1 Tax=Enterococcus nangangensis TaxID=2559926 RepID=UPI0010F6F194|nr:nitroreductase family protein [Enterococcus nangangensis]